MQIIEKSITEITPSAVDANDHSAGVEGDSQEWLRKNLYGSVYRT